MTAGASSVLDSRGMYRLLLTCDRPRRTAFACCNHDEKLNHIVVDPDNLASRHVQF